MAPTQAAHARGAGGDGGNARLELLEYRVTQVEERLSQVLASQGKNTALLIATLFTLIGGLIMLLVQFGGGT